MTELFFSQMITVLYYETVIIIIHFLRIIAENSFKCVLVLL